MGQPSFRCFDTIGLQKHTAYVSTTAAASSTQLHCFVVCFLFFFRYEREVEDPFPQICVDDEFIHNNVVAITAPVIRNGARRLWVHDMICRTQKMVIIIPFSRIYDWSMMLPAPLWKIKKFSTGSSQNGHKRKGERLETRRWALRFFSRLSSLRTIKKRCWHSEKKHQVDTGPKVTYSWEKDLFVITSAVKRTMWGRRHLQIHSSNRSSSATVCVIAASEISQVRGVCLNIGWQKPCLNFREGDCGLI